MRWRVLWAHIKADLLILYRLPGYWIPVLILPATFYMFLGMPHAKGTAMANHVMSSFATAAVVGAILFQFGTALSQNANSPWEQYLRLLPASAPTRFIARGISALVFAVPAALIMIAAALFLTPVHLGIVQWTRMGISLLIGSVPFALLGIAIATWMPVKAAIPVANYTFSATAYLGGFWLPPAQMPPYYQAISRWMPTRFYVDTVWSAVTSRPWHLTDWLGLTVYALIFAMLAFYGYRKKSAS